MVKRRNRPGPNNFQDEDRNVESQCGQTPEGLLRGIDPHSDPRRNTGEMTPVALVEREEAPQRGGEVVRRTSLDRDNVRPVVTVNRPAEERVDSSTGDNQRENVLDPTQDENGPESDQA
jgi:hypothetical protein